MTGLDIVVVVAYLIGIAALGWFAGRNKRLQSTADFFLGSKNFPWWIVGTSMVATTVAADTPLAVSGITIKDGVAGNWFWWAFIGSHVLVTVALARLWRRADVVTDAEFVTLRYADRSAPLLRSVKAFYFAVAVNCIIMGFVMLAMVKVSTALLPDIPAWQVIGGLLVLTLLYSVRSGYHAVVITDLVQFPIAIIGAFVLAYYAVDAAGGLDAVVDAAITRHGSTDAVAMFPAGSEFLPWHAVVAFLGIQWWAQKGADGGGIFIQRLLSARSEQDAERGGIWFMVGHYIIRPWPWIICGLAALALMPGSIGHDPELGYPVLIREVLPTGLRGLMVASFLAAFMSTIDTHLNWGASYLANDLIGPHLSDQSKATSIARGATILLVFLAIGATLAMDSIRGAWEFIIAFGAGAGPPILLRWYWWRITAASELAAMLTSTTLAVIIYALNATDPLTGADTFRFLDKLVIIVIGSATVWIPVAIKTCPDPKALLHFYKKVRPVGPGWRTVAATDPTADAPGSVTPHISRWAFGVVSVAAALLGLGHALLIDPVSGTIAFVAGCAGMAMLARA